MADGYMGKCKVCHKANIKDARERNAEHYKEFDRKRANLPHRIKARAEYAQTKAGKDAHQRSVKKWQIKHPNRRAASHILNNAVRDGKIVRLPCFICGAKAHAHHPDYDRPLDVIWLCPKHHYETHAMVNE
jgi:hypothetical protein